MKRKKILWLCSWYPSREEPFNGDFIQRHAIAAALYNDIHVLHITNDYNGELGENVQDVRMLEHLTEQIVYFKKPKSLMGRLTSQLQWLFLYKKTIRNYIIKNGKPDLVHIHIPMKAGILGLWIKKNYKIPYLLTEHYGIYNRIVENGYLKKKLPYKKIVQRVFKNASRFVSVSKYLAVGVNDLVCKKEYIVIPNTVNTTYFFYIEKEIKCFRFIHVSNMVPLKNPKGILRAFKKFTLENDRAELIMVGEVEEIIKLYALELGISSDQISFKGELSYELVASEMQAADCLILFSNIENSPCVIGEALCCGLPVIATHVGGIPELIDDTNGIMISPGNEEELINAIFAMVTDSKNYQRKKIAEIAKNKFSYSIIGKEIDNAYSAISSSH